MTVSTEVTPFHVYANDKMELRYSHVVQGRKETWDEIAWRVTKCVTDVTPVYHDVSTVNAIYEIIRDRKFIPGGRILSQAGRPYHQTDNCFCLRAEDSREGWADLAHKCTMMFMSGGGVGVDYAAIRPYGSLLSRSGGIASGPIPLVEMVDSIAAAVRQGGERRGACYASLPWWHRDIYDAKDCFIYMKSNLGRLKHTNISVRFDSEWIKAYEESNEDAYLAFEQTLYAACKYGDPGFQFDLDRQTLRNACTEIISSDDSDSCCIGSINLATIGSLSELADVTNLAILFLLCNTLYTDIPTVQVGNVKAKNRRLGLGLMGVAEWFMQRGKLYGYNQRAYSKDECIGQWLHTWQQNCDNAALHWSNRLNIARPIATRAIAPTGTISIMGHTTPGIEPVFHTAYIRTSNTLKTREYKDGYKRETVIDPIVQKWVELGYDVRDIDTAWTLSQSTEGIERRLAFQAYVQGFVDNAISSTVNLPPYEQGIEDKIAPILLKYLPKLRGVTFYPDGRHENQPVVPVDIADVYSMNPVLEEAEGCKGGECGL